MTSFSVFKVSKALSLNYFFKVRTSKTTPSDEPICTSFLELKSVLGVLNIFRLKFGKSSNDKINLRITMFFTNYLSSSNLSLEYNQGINIFDVRTAKSKFLLTEKLHD